MGVGLELLVLIRWIHPLFGSRYCVGLVSTVEIERGREIDACPNATLYWLPGPVKSPPSAVSRHRPEEEELQ